MINICYKDMVSRAKDTASEEVMLKSIDNVQHLLNHVKETCPEYYWEFIRSEQENMFGDHYSEEFALLDVSNMYHTDTNDEIVKGEHWSMAQAAKVAKEFKIENVADLYVALNAFYHDKINLELKWALKDLKNDVDADDLESAAETRAENRIIADTINFWFNDEDAPDGKIWLYMKAMRKE